MLYKDKSEQIVVKSRAHTHNTKQMEICTVVNDNSPPRNNVTDHAKKFCVATDSIERHALRTICDLETNLHKYI